MERAAGSGGFPDVGKHPEDTNVESAEGDQARNAQVETGLQEFIVSVADVHIRRDREQRIEHRYHLAEGVHPHAREREILDAINRSRPDLQRRTSPADLATSPLTVSPPAPLQKRPPIPAPSR